MNKKTKQQKKKEKLDSERSFRIIEKLDFGTIYEDSPVEVIRGELLNDMETYECFAYFELRNVSGKEIKALDVRLLFYEYANIPFLKLPFTYSYENFTLGVRSSVKTKKDKVSEYIQNGEYFGKRVYIPLPASYFKRFELEISSVLYADGTRRECGIISRKEKKSFSALNDDLIFAYRRINLYQKSEEDHPIQNLPQFTENAWLCCCGEKNLSSDNKCTVCLREREWQRENISVDVLERVHENIRISNDTEYAHMKKANVNLPNPLENLEDKRKKAEQTTIALQNVRQQEKRTEHNKRMIIPKILAYLAVMYAIWFVFRIILERQG